MNYGMFIFCCYQVSCNFTLGHMRLGNTIAKQWKIKSNYVKKFLDNIITAAQKTNTIPQQKLTIQKNCKSLKGINDSHWRLMLLMLFI